MQGIDDRVVMVPIRRLEGKSARRLRPPMGGGLLPEPFHQRPIAPHTLAARMATLRVNHPQAVITGP